MTRQRIKNTLMNRCKCCLRERPSKDMWNEHDYHDNTENYGVLLANCFQLPWHEPLSGTERICFLCIGRLRDAVCFKSQIMEAQKFKSELLGDALRLDDVADIEQKIQDFLEKNLNITVAFEPKNQTTMNRCNNYSKQRYVTNIDLDTMADQESTYNESVISDGQHQDNHSETGNSDEENTNTKVEYLDEEFLEMELGDENITTNVQTRDIRVELVTQVDANNDQDVIILGNTIIKKKNKDTKKSSKQLETAQEIDTVTKVAAAPEPKQDSHRALEMTEPSEQPGTSYSIKHEDNSTLSDSNEYEEKDFEHAQRTGDQRKMPWNKHTRRNYLIERTKQQVNLVALLLSTDATPIRAKTDKGYQCGFCQTHFYDPSDLRTHTHENHGKDEKTTYMAETTLSNLVVRLDITDLHCVKCYTSLDDLDTAWNHLQNHGIKIHTEIKNHIAPFKFKGDQLECVVCHKNMTFRGLVKHINSHFRNFVCEQCGEGFICKRLLDHHTLSHENGHYQCPYCSKHFTTRKQWTLHKIIHEKREKFAMRFVCGVCGDRFISGVQKTKHLESVHKAPAPEKRGVECQECGKLLSDKKRLRLHVLNVHHKLKRFQCDHCDKECFDSTAMRRHIEIRHLKYAALVCSTCSKPFKSDKKLKLHMRLHESDTYNCIHCTETFLTIAGRRSHMRAKHNLAPKNKNVQTKLNEKVLESMDVEELS